MTKCTMNHLNPLLTVTVSLLTVIELDWLRLCEITSGAHSLVNVVINIRLWTRLYIHKLNLNEVC